MKKSANGFTIVELLIVIIVIAILATISIVAYNGLAQKSHKARIDGTMSQLKKQLALYRTENDDYPATLGALKVATPEGVYYAYDATLKSFCLSMKSGSEEYFVKSETSELVKGNCGQTGTTTDTGAGAGTGTETGTINLARGKSTDCPQLTDEILDEKNYCGGGYDLQSVTIDLGSIKPISRIIVWHWWDGRTYSGTKTEISEDGTIWKTVYDGAVNGYYKETKEGKTIDFAKTNARYVRDTVNRNNMTNSAWWMEIKVF